MYPGEFIAVGNNGVTARSRDGHNWTKLNYPTTSTVSLYGVCAIRGSEVFYNQVEYIAIGPSAGTGTQSTVFLGWAGGPNSDGFSDAFKMEDQSGNPLYNMTVSFPLPTQSNVGYLYIGSIGIIANDIGLGATNTFTNTIQVYVEQNHPGQTYQQLCANNTSTSDTFTAIAVYSNYDTGTGAVIPGGGIVKSSRNGLDNSTWSNVFSDSNVPFYGCAYGNGTFIAGGGNNTVARSTDGGTTWTTVSGANPGAIWWYGAYGNGKFVLVGWISINGQNQGVIQYSTDNGQTWSKANPGTSSQFLGVSYSPQLNIFVAVGLGGAIVSVDG
jgi:hypothetical protein